MCFDTQQGYQPYAPAPYGYAPPQPQFGYGAQPYQGAPAQPPPGYQNPYQPRQ